MKFVVPVDGELNPPMNGAGLMDDILAIDPDMPFFFFLGHGLPSDVLERPCIEVFLKPHGAVELCPAGTDLLKAPIT
jgi:hypothetical protein